MRTPRYWPDWIADTFELPGGRAGFSIKLDATTIAKARKVAEVDLNALREIPWYGEAEIEVSEHGLLRRMTFPSGTEVVLTEAGDGYYLGPNAGLEPQEFVQYFINLYSWWELVLMFPTDNEPASCE